MIVIAIIGILAAIALPVYQDYTNRAKVAELVLAASSARTCVSEIVHNVGRDDAQMRLSNCDEAFDSTQYVSSMSVVDTTGVV
ncbi:MAG: prepilin-type cleavage/methylation domain-containing protein, partial [Thioalkalivibrionaceae bacterium]